MFFSNKVTKLNCTCVFFLSATTISYYDTGGSRVLPNTPLHSTTPTPLRIDYADAALIKYAATLNTPTPLRSTTPLMIDYANAALIKYAATLYTPTPLRSTTPLKLKPATTAQSTNSK